MTTDLDTLDSQLKDISFSINGFFAKNVENIILIGNQLQKAKLIFAGQKLPNLDFVNWCEENCGISGSTAFKYMSAAKKFWDYLPYIKNFDLSAIYYLSS